MSTLALSPHRQTAASRRRETVSTFAIAILGLVVLAAVAIALAFAIPQVPDIGALTITVT